MKLKELASPNPIVVSRTATLQEVAQQMRDHDIGMIPVCEDGNLIGVVTDRDLTIRGTADGKDSTTATVQDCMSQNLVTCDEEQEGTEAERIMRERQVRRLIVTRQGGGVVGVVSLGDLATRSDERCGVALTLETLSGGNL